MRWYIHEDMAVQDGLLNVFNITQQARRDEIVKECKEYSDNITRMKDIQISITNKPQGLTRITDYEYLDGAPVKWYRKYNKLVDYCRSLEARLSLMEGYLAEQRQAKQAQVPYNKP